MDPWSDILYGNGSIAITFKKGVFIMTIGTILLIILVLALVGVIPAWPHSRSWGYGPSGGVGLIVLILVILVVLGIF